MMASTLRRLIYLIRSWIPRTTMDGRNLPDFFNDFDLARYLLHFLPGDMASKFSHPEDQPESYKIDISFGYIRRQMRVASVGGTFLKDNY